LGLLTARAIGKYEVLWFQPAILAIAVAYLFGVRLVYLDQRIAQRTAAEKGIELHETAAGMSLGKALAGFAVCAAAILLAGPFLAEAADEIAELTGLGGTFVGTTLVAFCTSLPELVSSLAAVRLGAHDLAIGNVFGSNAFNMVLLAPLDAVHSGPLLAEVSAIHAITCVAAILATLVAIMGQLYQSESRRRFIEPDAWLVILIVAGALALVYFSR
jgi:cation:H+ antiporter